MLVISVRWLPRMRIIDLKVDPRLILLLGASHCPHCKGWMHIENSRPTFRCLWEGVVPTS